MTIRKLSEYACIPGFNAATSALLNENNLNPNDMKKNFPDLGKEYFSFKQLVPKFSVLKNTEKFISFIKKNSTGKIVNVCDYDCDGIMSSVILVTTLQKLGIPCDFVVPNRLEDGYGMSNALIDKAIEKGATAIITTDNGVSCREQVEYAKSNNINVFITDHHMPTDGMTPENVDIIDPCFNNDDVPGICGAFVIAKLCYALLNSYNVEDQYFINEIMTFAAIATITDMMPMLSENRLLMRAALEYIDFLKNRNIWNSVMKVVSGLGGYYYLKDETALASEELFGFYIGPTVNSVSRVYGDPSELIQNIIDCGDFGVYIDRKFGDINHERKSYARILSRAHQKTDEPVVIETLDSGDYEFPISGLLGLMANNISTGENKPALVGVEKDGVYEFSCRSIPGYSIHDAFERLKISHPNLQLDGGGHSTAMGLRFPVSSENLREFREALTEDFLANNSKVINNEYILLEDSCIDEAVDTFAQFKIFGYACKQPRFIYKGIVKEYDQETKLLVVGDYTFCAYLYKYPNIGSEMTVVFTVKYDSTDGAYFKVDARESENTAGLI